MRIFTGIILVLAAIVSTASAQTDLATGIGERRILLENGTARSGGGLDSGPSIWNNSGTSGLWWGSMETGYIALDWGKLPVPASGLPDHVVDGFTFFYGTNSRDPLGEEFAIYYFDQCTGWGNMGVQEAGFHLTGLPNGRYLPTLPPGSGWIWTVTNDLTGTGYEFLLGRDIGHAYARLNDPATGWTGIVLGLPPNQGGNGPTGTQYAFDLYYPSGKYNGSWWFSTGWATFCAELFGTEGQGNQTFYGVGAAGNDAALYASGVFAGGETVHYLLRPNDSGSNGYLAASFQDANVYLGGVHDVTRLVGNLIPGFPRAMISPAPGDFFVLPVQVPHSHGSATVYFQGVHGDLPLSQPPIDASNGLRAN